MPDPVLFEVRDRVALITVNDPDRRNVMTAATSAGMRAAVQTPLPDPRASWATP